jgi:hypothetical protein
MINLRETDISKGQTSKRSNGIVGADCPRAHLFQQLTQSLGVHSPILPHIVTSSSAPESGIDWTRRTIAFLGPIGTFSEQALLSQADLATANLRPKIHQAEARHNNIPARHHEALQNLKYWQEQKHLAPTQAARTEASARVAAWTIQRDHLKAQLDARELTTSAQ